jgi:hypothetical protein
MDCELKPVLNELDRREFIRLAMMSSAMLIASNSVVEAAEADSTSHSYAALHCLAPGTVQPEGWLRGYMEKQAAQLGSKLPQVSWPFTGAYWAGEENEEEGERQFWPWEQKAYWIDGATRLALVLEDEKLMAQVRASIDYTLEHADTDGYLGPQLLKEQKGPYNRWPHNVFSRSLMAYSDAQSPLRGATAEGVATELQKHYLGDAAK